MMLVLLLAVLQTDGVLRSRAEMRFLLFLGLFKLVVVVGTIRPLMGALGLPGAALAMLLATATSKAIALLRMRRGFSCSFRALLPWRGLAVVGVASLVAALLAWAVAAGRPGPPSAALAAASVGVRLRLPPRRRRRPSGPQGTIMCGIAGIVSLGGPRPAASSSARCHGRSSIAGRTRSARTSTGEPGSSCGVCRSSTRRPARSPSPTRTDGSGLSSTGRSTTTASCAASSSPAATASCPSRTPRRSCISTRRWAPRASSGSAGCSRSPSGTSASRGSCSRATGSASSRCTTRSRGGASPSPRR